MKNKRPTYQELIDAIDSINSKIKTETDKKTLRKLEDELLWTEEYLEHILARGRA